MGRFFGVGLKALLTAKAGRRRWHRHSDWLIDIALAGTVMALVFAYALFVRA